MSLQEYRQKYPQYDDLSDEQLMQGIHKKSYSDMPYPEFATKITKTASPLPPGVTPTGITSVPVPRQPDDAEKQQQTDRRTTELLGQLGGKVPSSIPSPRATQFMPGAMGARTIPGIPPQEQQRRRAFQELQSLGHSPEQIKLSMETQKVLGSPRVGRTAGGIGGAIAGTALAGRFIPGPIDDAAILVALIASGSAGLGGVSGEAIQTGIEEKRIINRREALKAFAIEAGTELGGRGIAVGAKKTILSPFIKKTVPEAAALIDDFRKVGGNFSPSELDRRFSLRIMEAFSRGGFGAQDIFKEFEEKQGKAVLAYADSIIDAIGQGVARETPEAIGAEFRKGITRPNGRVFQILDDLFDPLYGQLDDLTKSSIIKQTAEISVPSTILDETGKPFERMATKVIGERIQGVGVSTSSLKALRTRVIAQNQRLVDVAKRTGKELPLLSPAGKSMLDDINILPKTIGHSDYRAFRSKILKETRKLHRDADVSEGMIKEVSSITREELLNPATVGGASVEAKRLHANISRLYAKAQEGLETTFSERLAKSLLKNPSKVVKELFPANNPTAVRLLRESLVEPISGRPSKEGKRMWNQLRQQWLADAVGEATKEGVANPKMFNNQLRKLGTGFKEMFPEKDVAYSVRKIQTLFESAGRTPPTGASLFSRGAQVYGVTKMYKGYQQGDYIGFTVGGALAVGPLAFAKLATSRKGVEYLTAGFRAKPGSSSLVPNAVRMIKLLRDINKKENTDSIKAELGKTMKQRTPSMQSQRGFGGRGY